MKIGRTHSEDLNLCVFYCSESLPPTAIVCEAQQYSVVRYGVNFLCAVFVAGGMFRELTNRGRLPFGMTGWPTTCACCFASSVRLASCLFAFSSTSIEARLGKDIHLKSIDG